MIYLLILSLIALAVAARIAWVAAQLIATQNALIAEQRRGITLLRIAVRQQQERIDTQVQLIRQVEARNAWLEWAVSHYITCLPAMDRQRAEIVRREINWN